MGGEAVMTEFIITCQSELQKDGSYKIERYRELVRCKDCKHRDPEVKNCDSGHAIQWQLPRPDNWFCADGERKEGR